jgi:hypothetical protein
MKIILSCIILLFFIILILCKCKNKYIILCHAIEYSTLCEYIRSAFSNNVIMVYNYNVAYPNATLFIPYIFYNIV